MKENHLVAVSFCVAVVVGSVACAQKQQQQRSGKEAVAVKPVRSAFAESAAAAAVTPLVKVVSTVPYSHGGDEVIHVVLDSTQTTPCGNSQWWLTGGAKHKYVPTGSSYDFVPANHSYVLNCGACAGYITPSAFTIPAKGPDTLTTISVRYGHN